MNPNEVQLSWSNGRLRIRHSLRTPYRVFLADATNEEYPAGIPRVRWILNNEIPRSPALEELEVPLPEGPLTFRAREPGGWRSSYEFSGHTRDLPVVLSPWSCEYGRGSLLQVFLPPERESMRLNALSSSLHMLVRARSGPTISRATRRLMETLL